LSLEMSLKRLAEAGLFNLEINLPLYSSERPVDSRGIFQTIY